MLPIYRDDVSLDSLRAARHVRPFSRTSLRLCRRLRLLGVRPSHVIDVGANVGQFAAAAMFHFPEAQIDSFEPLEQCQDALRSLAADHPQLTVHPVALGGELGRGRLHINSHSHSSSFRELTAAHLAAFPAAQVRGVATCPVTTLDAILADRPMRAPVLLKLDVQGYELEVVEGGCSVMSRVDFVLCEAPLVELYEGQASLPTLAEVFREAGLALVSPIDILTDKRSKPLQADILFARADLPATEPCCTK
jgi:FkbM family methyltransferase